MTSGRVGLQGLARRDSDDACATVAAAATVGDGDGLHIVDDGARPISGEHGEETGDGTRDGEDEEEHRQEIAGRGSNWDQ